MLDMLKTKKSLIKDYCTIITGTFIVAVGIVVFISPLRLAPGGVYGIAIILHHLFGNSSFITRYLAVRCKIWRQNYCGDCLIGRFYFIVRVCLRVRSAHFFARQFCYCRSDRPFHHFSFWWGHYGRWFGAYF